MVCLGFGWFFPPGGIKACQSTVSEGFGHAFFFVFLGGPFTTTIISRGLSVCSGF